MDYRLWECADCGYQIRIFGDSSQLEGAIRSVECEKCDLEMDDVEKFNEALGDEEDDRPSLPPVLG